MFPISQCAIGQSYKLASHRLLFRSQHKLLTSKGMEWQLLAILFWRFTFKWTNVPSSLASFSYGCLFVSRKSTFCPRKNKQTKKKHVALYIRKLEKREKDRHMLNWEMYSLDKGYYSNSDISLREPENHHDGLLLSVALVLFSVLSAEANSTSHASSCKLFTHP